MRTWIGLLFGAAAVGGLAWSFWPSQANAATGTEDPSRVYAGEVSPPATVPDAAYGVPSTYLPSVQGGGSISEDVRSLVDGRVLALAPTIEAAATHFGVPTDLLAVVISRESKGQIGVVGDDGESYGLGQIQAETEDTINDYWGTDLNRKNWVHNVYLTAGNHRRLYEEVDTSYLPFADRGNGWYNAVRGHLCGLQGSQENPSCSAQEAAHRIATAGMSSQIPT